VPLISFEMPKDNKFGKCEKTFHSPRSQQYYFTHQFVDGKWEKNTPAIAIINFMIRL